MSQLKESGIQYNLVPIVRMYIQYTALNLSIPTLPFDPIPRVYTSLKVLPFHNSSIIHLHGWYVMNYNFMYVQALLVYITEL